MKFSDAFEKLNGRAATPSDVLEFERMVEILETTPTDAFLAVLVALGYHKTLYLQIPGMIAETTNSVLGNVKQAADKAMAAAAGKATAELAKAVSDTAIEVANNTSKKQMWKWAAGCISVSIMCVGLLTWYIYSTAYKSGVNSGYGAGYSKAVDEKAAASWANTAEGKLAYKLAQTNQFKNLVHCDRSGWKIQDGVCYPHKAQDDNVYGWQLPSL